MDREQKEELLEELVQYTKDNDVFFDVDGPIMVTVVLPDQTYRKKEIGAISVYLVGARIGAKDTIFTFASEESQPWKNIEVVSKDMDKVIPLFIETLREFGKKRFNAADGSSRLRSLERYKITSSLMNTMFSMQSEEVKSTIKEADEELEQLPTFGMF